MAIENDLSVDKDGNIRWTGAAATTHTVLAFRRYLGALADDAQAAPDDLIDMTSETPAIRSTDRIIDLPPPYNIDDTVAEHLYDGSVGQNDGDDLYSGLEVVGTLVAGTEPVLVQDGKVLPAYWGTGINGDAAELIIMRILVKSRSGGADIDNKKILTKVAELNDQYKEFPTTLGLANSTSAVSTALDGNNESSDATIEGWSSIVNTEGFQELDIDGSGAAGQEFYSKWDKGTQTLNDTFERTKWIGQRAHTADSNADVGSDFVVDNATILGQGQEFTANGQNEKLVEMRVQLKIGAGTPLGFLQMELIDSDSGSPAAPTGAVLATSEPVLVSRLTSTYAEFIFRFNDNVTLTASQDYFVVIRNVAADASNYVHIRGLATTGTHAGNRAEDTGTWAGVALDDLWFQVKSSPIIHGIAGEIFRGITTEIAYDTESGGPFSENEILFWGTQITYDTLVGGPFTVGEYVKIYDVGTTDVINGGKVLKDTGTVLTVALEDISGSVIADGDHITGLSSGATADINTTITDDDKAGGEGILLALDDNGVDGEFYIQRVSGADPVDGLPVGGRTSTATAVVDITVTARPILPEFVGGSTGTNIRGAYGIGFDPNDVGSSDQFISLDNTTRTPPNNVTFKVTGLVSTEDRVLVGPKGATTVLEKGQWLLSTALSGATETAIVVKTGAEATPIATDIPQDGTTVNTRLRVQMDSGIYRRQAYTNYTGSTFTIPSTDYSGANVAAVDNNVFCAFIDVLADSDEEPYTAVYLSDRDLFVRVRDGGATPIKTFEAPAVFGSTSSSIAAIRQSDL